MRLRVSMHRAVRPATLMYRISNNSDYVCAFSLPTDLLAGTRTGIRDEDRERS